MKYFPCFLFFDIFASKTRMKVIKAIWNEPKSVKEICATTGLEQSNVSHQLRLLQRCRVVKVKREGKSRIYRLESCIKPIIRTAEAHTKKHCKKRCAEWLKKYKK